MTQHNDGGMARWWNYPVTPYRGLDDSDANIMRELRHEPCEWHCTDCNECDDGEPAEHIPGEGDDPFCAECADWYWEQRRNREAASDPARD